jgi:hypothetical protein
MRRMLFLITVLGSAAVGTQAFGDDFWARVKLDFLRMNCWPEPFVQADRELVIAPLIAMTNSGWQLQNTLSHHFFDSETNRLTRAGQLKLHWILTQTPAHRRTVYVLRTPDPTNTEARLAAVQEQMQQLVADGPRPEVLVSDEAPAFGAGDYFDNVDRQLKASVPVPRLPPRVGTSNVGGE